ncbi:hypothetical protein [Gluconobacter cerinus]|uniref:hypothetical protein n=1 Tax=Gluconobacter cerinus TaxID=38307 RepID=UPI001B8C4AA3|nr:hypothetical protein [Gluconobacter cerinus]MBS1038091.1 hypothetical protein [Gluconobacter cerinus]
MKSAIKVNLDELRASFITEAEKEPERGTGIRDVIESVFDELMLFKEKRTWRETGEMFRKLTGTATPDGTIQQYCGVIRRERNLKPKKKSERRTVSVISEPKTEPKFEPKTEIATETKTEQKPVVVSAPKKPEFSVPVAEPEKSGSVKKMSDAVTAPREMDDL